MNNGSPIDADRLIQTVLTELNWASDPKVIAEHVRKLDNGLPVEDEFSVLSGWLGKCHLLHKLDQVQTPIKSRETFQVPDLIAQFDPETAQSPVLIEVKSHRGGTLSFKPEYLERLLIYAELLKLPLLIAWKFRWTWTLFEARHLARATKNFNISFELALKENLLGVLAGDVWYRIGSGAGSNLLLRKEELVEPANAQDGDHDEKNESWKLRVEEVYFTDSKGSRRNDISQEAVSILVATPDLAETVTPSETHFHISYLAHQDQGLKTASQTLLSLLRFGETEDFRVNWRHLLRKEFPTEGVKDFPAALNTALSQKVVSHIFRQRPNSPPDFLNT